MADCHLQELPRCERCVVELDASSRVFVLENTRNKRDGFLGRAFARKDAGKRGESRGFGNDQSMKRNRLRRNCSVQDERGEMFQYGPEVRSLDQRDIPGGPQALDDAMDDRSKQCFLIREAMIEGALRDTDALRHGFDGRGTKAVGKEQFRRSVENQIPKLLGYFA